MKKQLFTLLLTLSLSYAGFSGVTYFQYDDSFALTRTYFTYKTDISDELSFKFQTDVGRLDSNVDDERWTTFLKKAQLDWKFDSDMQISMGMIGMNMFNVQEKTWGNRFLYKSAMDMHGFSASADLGIAISQKYGNLTSTFMVSNGEGYQESEVDDKNKISLQVVMGETKLSNNNDYNFGLVYSKLEDVKVIGFFGGWVQNKIIAGGEYNSKDNGSTTDDLTSIYANYTINNKLTAFVRMDNLDIDTDTIGNKTDVKMVGIIWTPTKGLDICPNMISTNDEDTFKLNFQFKF